MLLLPASIQFVHAFEPHHEIICSSDVEHHFHQDELECVLCHLQAQNHLVVFQNNYELIPPAFYITYSDEKPRKVLQVIVSQKSSRAPPYFTV